ncbi:hypothetical protein LEP1GSC036_1318 [Leptospira weilii str. 2006001853]|uniref:Uncharacterized protein n=1 Tax=Leptospira weilii str. 2006001853 TaxID=1001589 RepID=A0A828Z017_9LEPT|nr:hypothetical protein LEP1GSC036_1318 [Leptospira weilii str. 2006001853]
MAGIIYRMKQAVSGVQFRMTLDRVKLVTEDFKNGNEREYSRYDELNRIRKDI